MDRARTQLVRDMRADDAFRVILADCLVAVTVQAAKLRKRRDAQALHRIRVALRRLEVVLGAFGKAFSQTWFGELRDRTKAVLHALGPARDLDVLLDVLWPEAARGAPAQRLRRKAERARAAAWRTVLQQVQAESFTLLLEDLTGLTRSRLPLIADAQIGELAQQMLHKAATRVRKRGELAQNGDEEALHRLRIALKKLRYLTQTFAALYPGKRLQPYLQSLRQLQEELGHLNDLAHVHTTLVRLAGTSGRSALPDRVAKARARAVRKALRRYDAFRQRKPYWRR